MSSPRPPLKEKRSQVTATGSGESVAHHHHHHPPNTTPPPPVYAIAAPRVKEQKKHPYEQELIKVQAMMEKFYGSSSSSSSSKSCIYSKKDQILWFSLHTFVAAVTCGVIMYILATVWFMMFQSARVIYTFPTNFSTPDAPKTVDVKTPFLSEVMYGVDSFTFYTYGCIMLIIAGLLGFYTLNSPYETRLIRFVVASLLFIVATITMIVGPLMAFTGTNSDNEKNSLDNDENYAYQQSMKGSIDYFWDRQCREMESGSLGDNNEATLNQMREFCSLLTRLIVILLFMWATVIIPVCGWIMCWFQIVTNRSYWSKMSPRQPKERTAEQQKANMCLTD